MPDDPRLQGVLGALGVAPGGGSAAPAVTWKNALALESHDGRTPLAMTLSSKPNPLALAVPSHALIPVDYDPFAVETTPVDHDPFKKEGEEK